MTNALGQIGDGVSIIVEWIFISHINVIIDSASPGELFWDGEILSSSCIRFSNDWLVRDSIMLFVVLVRNPLNSISFSN